MIDLHGHVKTICQGRQSILFKLIQIATQGDSQTFVFDCINISIRKTLGFVNTHI